MTNSTLNHNNPFIPSDEDADRKIVADAEAASQDLNAKKVLLSKLYPQGSSRELGYQRYKDIDMSTIMTADDVQPKDTIDWVKVGMIAVVFPLPFFLLDWGLVLFVSLMPNLVASAATAMMGIPFVLLVAFTMFGMKHYFDHKIDELGLNAFALFWSYAFFVFPIVFALRNWLVPTFSDGIAPELVQNAVYCAVVLAVSVAALCVFTAIYYRPDKSLEVRVRILFAVTVLPYAVGLIFIVLALTRVLQI